MSMGDDRRDGLGASLPLSAKWRSRLQFARRAMTTPVGLKEIWEANGELAKKVAKLPWSSPEELVSTLRAVNTRIHQTLLTSAAGEGAAAAKGIAVDLMEANPWMAADLAATPQLGCLAPLADPGTRLDYVRVFHSALLKLKQELRWSGLGSSTGHDIIDFGLGKRTGLEVAQSWALLTNLGHLWGTFATERAVLYTLQHDESARRELLRAIEPRLKEPARRIIDESAVHHFFYVLAALRVSSDVDEQNRGRAVALLRGYFDAKAATRPGNLIWSYRKARQVAYHRMHFFMQTGGAFGKLSSDHVLQQFGRYGEIVGDPHLEEDHSLFRALDAADAHHTETFLTSPEAARLTLTHLREFKRWWTVRREQGQAVVERLRDLFRRPTDWPALVDETEVRPMVRLYMPGSSGTWADEVRSWVQDAEIWPGANFLISPFPHRASLCCDVFVTESLRCSTARFIAHRLAHHTEQSWRAQAPDRGLWRSNAVFGIALLRKAFRTDVPAVEPIAMRVAERHAGYAVLASSRQVALGRLRQIVADVVDDNRRRELEAVAEICGNGNGADEDAPFLIFLGRVHLFAPDGAPRGDLDGVWASFHDDRIQWGLMEHKVTGQPSPRGPMEEIVATLRAKEVRLDQIDVTNGKAAIATFEERSQT